MPDWTQMDDKAKAAGLKDMTYYIVEVAFSKENVLHTVVAFHRHIGDLVLFTAGYTNYIIEKNFTELYSFRILSEIPAMNRKDPVRLPDTARPANSFKFGEPI